ncbi:MAG: endolytic transglycosylase MltG [Chromatiales bacterium]|nr:endolytic transglycosylase MltG [Chromatiales bacterium]
MRRLVLAILVLGICLGVAGGAWIRSYLATPLKIPADGYRLEIPSGSSWSTVVRKLAADGIVEFPEMLTAYGRLTGHAGRVKAGEYGLLPGTTPPSLLDLLESGRVLLHKMTLVEGWTVPDILRAIRAEPAINKTLRSTTATELAQEMELPWSSAEGAFLPETYLFARGESDRGLLSRAHGALLERLGRAWDARQPDLPLASPYELLTLASIVERETALASERPLIAGVFIRRLQKGMRLQTDPTVIYGLGSRFDGNLTRRDLETDSPWNTYTRNGLPPTPIAAPSGAAIDASAMPADGTALFFVATGAGDGSHRFSDTLREHEEAVRDYLAALNRRNRN